MRVQMDPRLEQWYNDLKFNTKSQIECKYLCNDVDYKNQIKEKYLYWTYTVEDTQEQLRQHA